MIAMSSMSRVLIVDDDAALLQALPDAITFRFPGTVVETTWSGQIALDMAQTTDYEAIVVDLKMSGLNGLEVITRLQILRPGTPALLLTAHGDRDIAIKALRTGAYAFIEKPIDRDFFMAWLERAMQHHRLLRQVQEKGASS
jgi:two-component system, sensor histidine kinase and response regulator